MWKPSPRALTSLLFLALLVFAGVLLFWRLGTSSFHSGDEAFHAQCAHEMMDRGDYLTPHYAGKPFLEKPPAKMWLIIAGFRLLGINEWGARLSSAVFALATVAMTVWLGRALFGMGPGLLAGTVLACSVQFVHEHCGRTAEMEPETVFLVTASMFLIYRMTRNPRWASLLGLALGALILVKGPIALPVMLIAVLYLALSRPLPAGTWRHVLLGAIVMLAVAVPWHAYMLATHGPQFREVYLRGQVLGRLTGHVPEAVVSNLHGLSSAPRPFFYAPVLFYSLFPWSLLALPALLPALVLAVRRPDRELRLLVLWFLVFAATITLANAKFPWYAVPLLPSVALFVAWLTDRLGRADRNRWVRVGGAVVLAVSLFLVPSPRYAPYAREATLWPYDDPSIVPLTSLTHLDPAAWLPLVATAALLGVLGILALLARGRPALPARIGFRRFVVASLLLTGACQVVLPLRGADNREFFTREFADCAKAVRERGLSPKRVLVLDEKTLDLATKWVAFFYVYEISGGSEGSIARLVEGGPRNWEDPNVVKPATVLLGQPRWAPELRATGLFEELHLGRFLYATYAPPGSGPGA